MPLLRELGSALRQRRLDMGMSQEALSRLAGLSRATVNELERGKLNDLSANRLERLANELGFAVGLVGTDRAKDRSALEAAARVASVPYTNELPPAVLEDSLTHASVPPAYIPHLRTLLQEAAVAILAGVVDELRQVRNVPVQDTWKHMRMLARVLKSDRPLWQNLST